MDVAGALAFDDGGVVVGDPQRHFCSELLAQIVKKRLPSVDCAGGVLRRNDRKDELGIFGLPVLRARASDGQGADCGANH